MQMHIKKKLLRLILCLCIALSLGACFTVTAQAGGWVDREGSGIYNDTGIGQGIGSLDMEEDGEEDEEDEETLLDGIFGGIKDLGKIVADIVGGLVAYLPRTLAEALFGLIELMGASLDTIIYGSLVTDSPMFTYDLNEGNFYGIVSMAVYGYLAPAVAAIMVAVVAWKLSISGWKRGSVAGAEVKETIYSFALSILLLFLMPYLLDILLYIRDALLHLVGTEVTTSLFNTGKANSLLSVFRDNSMTSGLNGFIYLAAVVLNLWFMLVYGGVVLSMVTNVVFFPFVVLRSMFDKDSVRGWVLEITAGALVPVIDAVLLTIPAFLGYYADQLYPGERGGIGIIQLILCYMIIPARNHARSLLGMRTNGMENSGLLAGAMIGRMAAGLIGKKFQESRVNRKNAKAYEEKANMEDELAQNERDEENAMMAAAEAERKNRDMPTAEEVMNGVSRNGKDGAMGDKDKPYGEKQSYARGLEGHIAAEEDELGDIRSYDEASLTPEERLANARRLSELDNELEQSKAGLEALKGVRNNVLNDDELSAKEKADKLSDIDDAIGKQNADIEGIEKERDELLGIDGKIRAAHRYKNQLENERADVEKNPDLSDAERGAKLDSLDRQIEEAQSEIEGLQLQKRKMNLEQEKGLLEKEPSSLRSELSSLRDSKEELQQQREALVRERNTLKEEQIGYSAGSKEHAQLQDRINGLNEQISAHDEAISDNGMRQDSIMGALKKQEYQLRDRQAYNLQERVKANKEYEAAKADMETCEQRIASGKSSAGPSRERLEGNLKEANARMEAAQQRIAQISAEDRKISQRLQEIAPEGPGYSMEDLKSAKAEIGTRKAQLQQKIAEERLRMEKDPAETAQCKLNIAEYQKEIADYGVQGARIDQMMQGMQGVQASGGRRVLGASAAGTAMNMGSSIIADEYDRKRAAILERHANVDNFESPEFAGISREKRAQLYREHALRFRQVFTGRNVAGAAGAVFGGMMGIWLGPTGVAVGGMMGGSLGAEIGENIASRRSDRRAGGPVDYKDKPLDFKVIADVADVTPSGVEKNIIRYANEVSAGFSSDKFQQQVQAELVGSDLLRAERQRLFQEYGVTKDNYEEKRKVLLPEMYKNAREVVVNAEKRIIGNMVGKDYTSISDEYREVIFELAGEPTMEPYYQIIENNYLYRHWMPEYEVK